GGVGKRVRIEAYFELTRQGTITGCWFVELELGALCHEEHGSITGLRQHLPLERRELLELWIPHASLFGLESGKKVSVAALASSSLSSLLPRPSRYSLSLPPRITKPGPSVSSSGSRVR